MNRGCFISLGVVFLISNGLQSVRNPPDVGHGAGAIGFLVGYWGIPIGLILVGLFKSDKKANDDAVSEAPGAPALKATDVPSSWSQLSPITKGAIGCLGLLVGWLVILTAIALFAKLSGAA